MSSRGRSATPADFLLQDCSPYSHQHVRRESLGFVHRSATFASLYHGPSDARQGDSEPELTLWHLQLGLTVAIAGDLVLVSAPPATVLGKRKAQAEPEATVEEGKEEHRSGRGSEGAGASRDGGEAGFVMKQVKVLTAEEAAQTSIFDVVMPLPGVAVTYPTHAVGVDKYRAKMAQDGVDVSDMHHSQKAYNLQGDYRNIVARWEGGRLALCVSHWCSPHCVSRRGQGGGADVRHGGVRQREAVAAADGPGPARGARGGLAARRACGGQRRR
jgi:hypothetical protein